MIHSNFFFDPGMSFIRECLGRDRHSHISETDTTTQGPLAPWRLPTGPSQPPRPREPIDISLEAPIPVGPQLPREPSHPRLPREPRDTSGGPPSYNQLDFTSRRSSASSGADDSLSENSARSASPTIEDEDPHNTNDSLPSYDRSSPTVEVVQPSAPTRDYSDYDYGGGTDYDAGSSYNDYSADYD